MTSQVRGVFEFGFDLTSKAGFVVWVYDIVVPLLFPLMDFLAWYRWLQLFVNQ